MRALPITALLLLAACDGGLVNGDGRIYAGGESFGHSIALDGETALVGAVESEEAFILRREGGGWEVQRRLTPPPNAATDDDFSWDVALDGDLAVVGAPGLSTFTSTSGAVHVFERQSGMWAYSATLRPPAGAVTAVFGLWIAASGQRIAVADEAPHQSGATGSVYVYERGAGGWGLAARVADPVPALQEDFGGDVALDGDRLAVGAEDHDEAGAENAGLVRVYQYAGGAWTQTAELVHPAPVTDDRLGTIIALDGPYLAVAAHGRDAPGVAGSGSVLIFRESGGAWTFEAELMPRDLGELDSFSFGLAVTAEGGGRVAVSAAGRERSRGSVFVYARSADGTWALEDEVWPAGLGSNSGFGEGIAIQGDRLLAGAVGVDGFRGGVYEFARGPGGWRQVTD